MAEIKWEEVLLGFVITLIAVMAGLWIYHMYVHVGVVRSKIDAGELTSEGLPAITEGEETAVATT